MLYPEVILTLNGGAPTGQYELRTKRGWRVNFVKTVFGLTDRTLADFLGVDPGTVSAWECGEGYIFSQDQGAAERLQRLTHVGQIFRDAEQMAHGPVHPVPGYGPTLYSVRGMYADDTPVQWTPMRCCSIRELVASDPDHCESLAYSYVSHRLGRPHPGFPRYWDGPVNARGARQRFGAFRERKGRLLTGLMIGIGAIGFVLTPIALGTFAALAPPVVLFNTLCWGACVVAMGAGLVGLGKAERDHRIEAGLQRFRSERASQPEAEARQQDALTSTGSGVAWLEAAGPRVARAPSVGAGSRREGAARTVAGRDMQL